MDHHSLRGTSRRWEASPLLKNGFVECDLEGVARLCVDPFPASERRRSVMAALEAAVAKLVAAKLFGTIWLDGSFLTKHPTPGDADFVFCPNPAIADDPTPEQRELLDKLSGGCDATFPECDTHLRYEYPRDHPKGEESEYNRAYWATQFGTWGGGDKGIAVIKVGPSSPAVATPTKTGGGR